jgi:hypothetical protein
MNRGPSPEQSEGLFEPLDIDIDSLDHALMDLLTSDWQTLDDGDPHAPSLAQPQLSPAA